MSVHLRSVVIHGHFYQPPREDPWLDEVEAEPSAAPYHDWNQRIDRECYRAVVAARLPGRNGRIARIVNTLEWISFNVGPTLMEWLEREAHDTYHAILAADRVSAERLGGHGNAIAMPYHHTILPLSSRRDKTTEVRWGIENFRRRFGREPAGMWLPETAVDHETLDVLAAEGIRFTILAPQQVVHPPPGGLPGRYRTSGGRELAIFVYFGSLSHDIAFGPLLRDARAWAERLVPGPDPLGPDLVSVATDGETFGHHHAFGEMALASVLDRLSHRPNVRIENFASFLARHPPIHDVELIAPSSWSCPHGVERWRSDCGCKMVPGDASHQRWRAPLRQAVDWLADELDLVYEREAAGLFSDPWAVRDAFGQVVSDGVDRREFVAGVLREPSEERRVRALELLEMEQDALRMFTSCGWFFDDIARIEPRQVMRYAAHGIELAGAPHAERLEQEFLAQLARAPSNDSAAGTARDIYLAHVKPGLPAEARVAAGCWAAQQAGVDPRRSGVRAYWTDIIGGTVSVTNCSTTRRADYTVSLTPSGAADLAATVETAGASPVHITMADLPEHQRALVASARRAALAEQWLSAEDRAVIGRGDARFDGVVRHALVEAAEHIADGALDQNAARVIGLVDLIDLCGVKIPFDAQTRFARAWSAMSDAERRIAAPVAYRLGFVADEMP